LTELLLESGVSLENLGIDNKTALHTAVESVRGPSHPNFDISFSIVELLLTHGANVNHVDANGETVLYKACNSNILQLASVLLQRGADPNLPAKDKCPLIAACRENNVDMVKLLLTNGAKAEVQLEDIPTPYWNMRVPLCIAACKNIQVMHLLIEHGADVNQKDKGGETALHIAVQQSSCSMEGVDLLLNNKADINVLSMKKESPLYLACKAGKNDIAEKMLTSSSLVNQAEAKQPLLAAIRNAKLQLVELLLQHGADCNAPSLTGEYRSASFELPLCTAAEYGQVDIVKCLLRHGARVNDTDGLIKTPLYYVIDRMDDFVDEACNQKSSHQMIFGTLLENGADTNKLNVNGETALCLATARGLTRTVCHLLKNGGNPNLASVRDYPLSIASRNSNVKMVNILLCGGADPNLYHTDPQSSLPLFCAVRCYNNDIMDLLLENGAKIDRYQSEKSMTCPNGSIADSNLSDFILSFNNTQEHIIKLFKAGAALTLLSFCCDNQRSLFRNRASFSRLCQAIVLSGYQPQHKDFETLAQSENHHCQQLLSWLKTDTKTPPSLIRQSRVAIRRQLLLASGYRSILPLIDRLPIPNQLKLYVKFEGHLSEVDLDASDLESDDETDVYTDDDSSDDDLSDSDAWFDDGSSDSDDCYWGNPYDNFVGRFMSDYFTRQFIGEPDDDD
jgi:ankyrin repeat protein